METFNIELYHLRQLKALNKLPNEDPVRVEMLFGQKWKVKKPKGTSQVEAQICEFLKLKEHAGDRVKTSGTYRANKIVTHDVIGRAKVVDAGKYTPSQATIGASDISATIYGLKVAIEVKIGSDKQSEAQKIYQANIELAGGYYWIVKSTQHFYELFNEFMKDERVLMNKEYLKR